MPQSPLNLKNKKINFELRLQKATSHEGQYAIRQEVEKSSFTPSYLKTERTSESFVYIGNVSRFSCRISWKKYMLPIHASTSRLHLQNQWLWTDEGYAMSHRSSYRTEVFDALGSVEADSSRWSVPETG